MNCSHMLLQIRGEVAEYERTHPGGVGPPPQAGDAPGRAGRQPCPRPGEDWITVPVPPIVSEETFAQVQAKLDASQQAAARNTRHEYLLRALVSCGACRLSCGVRQTQAGAWLPQELHARQAAIRQALGQLDRQQQDSMVVRRSGRAAAAYGRRKLPSPLHQVSGNQRRE